MHRSWLVVLFSILAIGVFSAELYIGYMNRPSTDSTPKIAIGGSFEMTNHLGKAVTEKDYAGKPMAMFFGFTACPDICPTTLARLTSLLESLGSDGDRINVVLVSVDPERDTPELLASYLQSFDRRITALTGTPEQLAKFAKKYRVYYEKIPEEGGNYTMNHTSGVLLFDASGEFRSMLDAHEDDGTALQKLRNVIEG